MTEKRFYISCESNQNIYDTVESCYYSSIDAMKLCDLLNDLQQEANDNEHYHSEVLRLYKAVSEENEQLKQQLDEMITIFENSGLDYHISDELNEILNR